MNAGPLDPVSEFSYLGRTVAYKHSDWENLYQSLQKARWQWDMVGKVVKNMGAMVQAQGML